MEERVAEDAGDVLDSRRAGSLIIQGGIVRGGGYVAGTLLALIGIALVTRHLGVDDFGRFQTVVSLITVVGAVTDAGMATLGLREFAQRAGDDRRRLMQSLLGLRLVLTVAGTVIATGIAAAVGYDLDLVLGTALAGVGLAFIVLQTTLTIPLAAELRNVALTALEIARQALTVAGYAILVALGAGVVAFLGVTIPVGIVLVVAAAVLVAGRMPLRPTFALDEWSALLRAAAAFAMATAVGVVYLYTSQILTAAVTDARDTGLFAASFRVFVVVAMVPGLLITVAFPLLSRAARDDRERLAYAVQRLLDTTLVLGLGAALGVALGAPVIIDVMAGSSFADAVPALRIQSITLVATFIIAPIGFALLSLHDHRGILVANVVALTVMLASVGALASAFGPEGAAAGTVIGEVTLGAGYLLALHRSAPDVSPGFERAWRSLVAAAPGFALLAVPGLPSLAAVVVGLTLYALLLAVLRAVPDELLEPIRRWREGRR
jgi:O-antigen/teichoic acid export membrane protein